MKLRVYKAAAAHIPEDDCDFVQWDGHNLDAFGALLAMVAQGKPVRALRADGRAVDVASIDDVRALLPERNPQHRHSKEPIDLHDQQKAVERFVPSKRIAQQFAIPYWKWEIIDVILGSPTALEAKLDALEELSKYDDVLHEILDDLEKSLPEGQKSESPEDRLSDIACSWGWVADSSFSTHRDAIKEAFDSLGRTGPGHLVYRKTFWDERPELFEEHEAGIAPFPHIQAALKDLRFEMERDEWDEDSPFWSTFEKWELTADGTWSKLYTFYAIRDEIVFFERNSYDEDERWWRTADARYCGSSVLNIKAPFNVGDVVVLDCRPFAPLRHALVLEAERPEHADCCMPRVLLLDDHESQRRGVPTWTEASPKHAHGLNMCMPGYSPLYHMELHQGPLPEDEQLIEEVQNWLQKDLERGKLLCEAMRCDMTEDEIRSFISASPSAPGKNNDCDNASTSAIIAIGG